MDQLVHADIFFFITAIAVVIISIGLAIVLYFVIDIVLDVRAVVKKVRKASSELEQDFEVLRSSVKEEGVRVKTIVELVLAFIARQIPKGRKKKGEE